MFPHLVYVSNICLHQGYLLLCAAIIKVSTELQICFAVVYSRGQEQGSSIFCLQLRPDKTIQLSDELSREKREIFLDTVFDLHPCLLPQV